MKVTVKDSETLEIVNLNQVRNYLQIHGWNEDKPFLENATLWHKPVAGEEFEILLPNQQNLGDYAARIREIIEILESVENRSQSEILADLITGIPNTTIQGVVMQIHTPNADQLSGEITLVGVIADKLQKIKTELADKDYILAIKAYQERLPFVCTGDLIKENQTFILKNPRNFTLDNLWQN
ncbi:MAG: hypothetical protein JGK12_02920 [Microcoleus sp. PH2017_01_SCD_O_A]|uniref:hypothetical protein n=1 Tax=unclassified Microcoleus TaxID=2642155 RepID=UPI001D2A90F7|nr:MULTISPECIES: hypothetical protein [unclassified Microcoleus]MCC3433815.1 hypothetical protein [Microcoleus sp. PH2017_04_SCI_O_A]TAE68174.1 MAG: hypothetical protein EAZ86_14165 [Oscillatoriales cyanobacterium]MCC3422890.1 hypothetical protein [Microcoleus sp. PH2017_01_SCD_O_A]MCC3455216.1 hypothetical protein [Microcoleus sp. PH2017_08_TRC_O_A]TAG64965.1 MAG: hypothetical protein EAZ25_18140 [Oscillatoriales cyanobacterium]